MLERNSKLNSKNSKLTAEVGLENVAVVADAPGKYATPSFECDEIESARVLPKPEPAEVGRRSPCQDLLFLGIQGRRRSPEISTGPRLHLDEDGLAPVPHDEVELAAGAAPVAVAWAVALAHEEQQGGPFGASAEAV